MHYGKTLRFGDTVGLIGPSGAIRTSGALERAIAETERMGFRVKLGESCGQQYGSLSGTDALRARDVNRMFRDDSVDAIFCLRGGYGTMRMLDLLDYEAMAANPKAFLGYSDITAMHIAMLEKAHLATFHGPMPVSCWADAPLDDFSRESLYRAIMRPEPIGELVNPPEFAKTTVQSGACEGMLVGGNLSLVTGVLGTPWELDTRGRILFLEDIGEYTYKLDHMLTHLRLAGKFEDCAGIVLGDFRNCEIEHPGFGFTLEELVRDIIAPCGKPIFMGLRAGHCTPKLTLPFGVQCRMDADACTLTVLERATA